MNSIYEFNGRKYRLRNLDLGMLHKASPLLIKYRELIFKYSSGIDTSKLLYSENEVSTIKLAIDEAMRDIPVDDGLLSKLRKRLREADQVLLKPEIITLKKHIAEIECLALFEIITDAEFVSGLFSDILLTEEGKKANFDKNSFSDLASIEFIKKVIADFFLSVQLPTAK